MEWMLKKTVPVTALRAIAARTPGFLFLLQNLFL